MIDQSGPLPKPVGRRRSSINLVALGTAGCLAVGLFCVGDERLVGMSLSAIAGETAAGNLLFPAGAEITTRSPMLDAVIQNTPGYSEGYAVGVPPNYAWCSGSYKPPQHSGPPPDFTAVSGWGQIYQDSTRPTHANPNARVEVANSKTFVHLRSTGEWVLVQDQADNPIGGGHFVPDFKGNAGQAMNITRAADGTASFDAPTASHNDHFWSVARGTYQPGDVDGVYVQMDLRVTDPKMNLVANAGADWWRDSTADFVPGFANNPTAGTSNWITLSSGWSTLRFYSPSTSEFMAAPPPLLASRPDEPAPSVTRRRANISAPCRSRFVYPLPEELLRPNHR